MQTTESRLTGSLLVALLMLGAGMCLAKSQDEKHALGELRLEGKYVEYLALRRDDGQKQSFNKPQETVKLPVGKYMLQEIRLKGGYEHRPRVSHKRNRITISGQKPTSLGLGAPLKQTITAGRRGRILELSYGLTGAGGENYAVNRYTQKPPAFSVYKGDRKIATGQFEFG
ncbi:MAG: hypothetical protein JSW47_13560 [Phycisphaerales bacterium]|nr:MAG: hypothetical protein JSW47_13560 [Phycisphaerales bacterium]